MSRHTSGFQDPLQNNNGSSLGLFYVPASGGGFIPISQIPISTVDTRTIGEIFTPLEWQNKLISPSIDANQNYIEDTLETMIGNVDVLLALTQAVGDSDIIDLSVYGTPGYKGRFLTVLELDNVAVTSLNALAGDFRVAMVYWDGLRVTTNLDVSRKAMKLQASQDYSTSTLEDQYPSLNGSGVTIAIIDSGVDDDIHEMLPGNSFRGGFVCYYDSLNGRSCGVLTNPDDDNGHGTHVAGIAIGRKSNQKDLQGVAPQAGLVDIKVLNSFGWGSWTDIIHGIEECIARKDYWGIDVANLSLGAPNGRGNGQSPVAKAIDRLASAGIVPVVAAGNSRSNGPGYFGFTGSAEDCITVASADDRGSVNRNDDIISSFSSFGPRIDGYPKPDITCYGTAIESALYNSLDASVVFNGTSMAAPHVAGLVALILQQNPEMKPLSVKELLIKTAEDRNTPGWDPDFGWGLVDAWETFSLLSTCSDGDLGFVFHKNLPAPNWKSEDIIPGDPNIVENQPNSVTVEVTNFGNSTIFNYKVRVGIFTFGATEPLFTIATEQVFAPLAPGASAMITVPWTPKVDPGTGTVHACLKAEVIFECDTDFSNNNAQRNILIRRANSPAEFRFEVRNAFQREGEFELVFQNPSPANWDIVLSDTNFTMEDCAPPKAIDVQLIPNPNTPLLDTVEVSIGLRGRPVGEPVQFRDLTGVTIIAINDSLVNTEKPTKTPLMRCSPVPTSDQLRVEVSREIIQSAEIRLLSLQGELLLSKGLLEGSGIHETVFDLSRYASGSYLVELVQDGVRVESHKVVKQ